MTRQLTLSYLSRDTSICSLRGTWYLLHVIYKPLRWFGKQTFWPTLDCKVRFRSCAIFLYAWENLLKLVYPFSVTGRRRALPFCYVGVTLSAACLVYKLFPGVLWHVPIFNAERDGPLKTLHGKWVEWFITKSWSYWSCTERGFAPTNLHSFSGCIIRCLDRWSRKNIHFACGKWHIWNSTAVEYDAKLSSSFPHITYSIINRNVVISTPPARSGLGCGNGRRNSAPQPFCQVRLHALISRKV